MIFIYIWWWVTQSGESLFNDGTAYVFFILFKKLMSGDELSAWGVCLLFLQLAAGGCAIGVAMGLVMNFLMKVFFPLLVFSRKYD